MGAAPSSLSNYTLIRNDFIRETESLNSEKIAIFYKNKKDGLQSDKLWVITESDRTVTTLLLPEEY
jgi:hypothetical protein